MKKRKRKAVIRWHNFNIEKEPEKHYRSHIMLFLPWRREEKLRANYMSYEDRYNDEIDQIKATETRKPYGFMQSSFWVMSWFVVICSGPCHGLW